ncbi:acetate--CoA ligase [Leptolyngbya sp. FACHB-17]|uniref:acetate--CoA ligase n=1 Tax=unclassified Leptolyngbya TaxID=2650499 RepID=UPI00168070E3|nr:acetate--CoA ligase [Leptolyngbya sp. FACHB-17]MBD2080912.1 acetate--CoA ligase [Leptolyngbya sp. FACHB-17]
MSQPTIESILHEDRLFPPSAEFSQRARIKNLEEYQALYDRAKADPLQFWSELAEQELHWFQKWDTVLDWSNPPFAKWFVNGKINLSYNCLDRHLETDRRNKPAIVWEGEPGDSKTLTYAELHQEVCKFANVLKSLGVKKGDGVGIYMPMIPEAAIAMLACARIGAPHSVVFGGFSAEALRDRLIDAEVKVVVTADGGWRKDAIVPLKPQVDKALAEGTTAVEKVVVVKRTGQDISMEGDRDLWWHDLEKDASTDCPAEPMDSEDMLFILYTSGSTGKPKGVVHTTGGYNLYAHMTAQWIFDLQENDVYWCTADVGWITGHSYVVYGPLSNGATTVMYEGAPRGSNPGCFWDVIQKHKVSVFYTAPTAIRAFIKMGDEHPKSRDLSSLRLLGTVGEPINPEAWMWYHSVIGKERCPIVDTWWQTETGGIMITPLPGAIPTKPGSATLPFPGILADVVDLDGNSVPANEGGYLAVRHPWPGMMRTVYKDPDRFRKTYWEHIPPKDGNYIYFAGDGARRDEDGYFWVMGRVDDVINVAGHRLGTMEVESALVSHPAVAEAAVVGKPDEIKGQDIVAFVTLEGTHRPSEDLAKELKKHVVSEIGAIARPGEIRFADALPKTRSGKIMRRLLRDLAAGTEISGDTSTLEDRGVLEKLRAEGS